MGLSQGSRLGPYEILAPLGAGGMGEVYRARDTRLKRDVAIKILSASFAADAERLRRFEQEAQAASALNHPNITAVYDIGSHEGAPYIVQELLEGQSLRAILAGGPLAPRRAIEYALQIAHGLAAAHEKGIVHRDLKPENIFVTRDGRGKILDFGLAKAVGPPLDAAAAESAATAGYTTPGSGQTALPTETPATNPGEVLGTLSYMSPEQVRGWPTDARSDIFSFGAILYEMLSGQRAFRRVSGADTISAILKEDPPDLSATNRQVPPALDRVVRHCLEKDPGRRFQSAGDLAFDLAALSNLSETALAPAALRRAPAWVWVWVWVVPLIAALLVLAGVLLWRTRAGPAVRPGSSAPEAKSIAVLPFQNLSPDPENAFFADGVTEDILTQLSKIRDLNVISRSSILRYKGTQKSVQTIAAELGVGTILEGSVRRAGGRVRIVGQLIDAKTDKPLWAETYDRDLKDVFAIQSEVAQQIATALRATLSAAEKKRIEQSPTKNLAAYDQYLMGRELYYRYRKADNESAIEFFQKAVELDPGFALPYAGLGDAYAQRALRFGFPASWLDSSLQMSGKAIAIDPELAEGYKASGLAFLARAAYKKSLEENKKAVEVNPGHAAAIYNTGAVLRFLGRYDEALSYELQALKLDPGNPMLANGTGGTYAALRNAVEGERWLKRSLEMQPELGQTHGHLIWLYFQEGRAQEAVQAARAALARLPKDPWVLNAAAMAELVAGDPARAEELYSQALPAYRGTRGFRDGGAGIETNLAFLRIRQHRDAEAKTLLDESLATDRRLAEKGNEDWSVPFDTACVHALRGEKDEAFRWLDKAIESGWRGFPIGTRDLLLDSLKTDPRYPRLESRLTDLITQMRKHAGLN